MKMTNEAPGQLPDAEILRIGGAEAEVFLQAQLASRIDALQPGRWQWTAWLDAAGRVRMLGMIWRLDTTFHILLRGGSAAAVRSSLQRYVLRSQVEITSSKGQVIGAGAALPEGVLLVDASGVRCGLGAYSLQLAADDGTTRTGLSFLPAILAGHPWLPAVALDSLLPPALNLYALGAVVLGKGCYPGQELVNRLHRRGGHKYGLAHWRISTNWQAGDTITLDGRKMGLLLMRDNADALLVIHQNARPAALDAELVQQFSPAAAANAR